MNEKFGIRACYDADKNFIFSTWLQGLYFGNDWFNQIPKDIFFKNYQKVVESILSRPEVKITICCLYDDKDVIIGYSVTEKSTLHWIFVKDSWRKMGVAKMITDNIKTCTHLTRMGISLKRKYDITFNPFFEDLL